MTAYVFIVLLIGTTLISLSYFCEWLERRHYVYAAIATIVLSLYAVALTEGQLAETDLADKNFWKMAGLYLGPLIVAVGWIVTNEINILNSRKQHTINLITQYFTNAQRIADKDLLNKRLPPTKIVSADEYPFDDTAHAFLRGVLRELNYFDFIGSAVLHRDIDEALVRRVFATIVHRYYRQYGPFIEYWRAKNPAYWADFVALFHRWHPNGLIHDEGVISD